MTSNHKQRLPEIVKVLPARGKLIVAGGIFVLLLFVAFVPLKRRNNPDGDLITYTVSRGGLVIDVLESGSVEASQSEIIRSKVEGKTTIISIVPEGTIITDKDVEEKRVLVELDSSQLRDNAVQQEITVQGELAKYTDARESYEIQVNQNESDLKAGELKVKFAKMDLEKYLGEEEAGLFIEGKMELASLIESEYLGGEALQKKREIENKIDLAREEVARASVKLEWTKKLYDKGYVTRDDLQADELALKRNEVGREQAETELRLFERYEFQKEAEKLRSDYEEALKELERTIAKNRAELSKAEAKLTSTEATYKQQVEQLKKVYEQIENCTIRATTPGLVIYAGDNRPWRSDRIEEGTQVIENQEIIKIPNTSSMKVTAKIHESVIARISSGQRVSITVDSLPEKKYEGVVKGVAILPDAQNWWLNPNLKVYETDVSILGNHPELKPGMSAQVRITINELEEVLLIPVQGVTAWGDERICFVMTSSGPEMRVIQTGDYNDKFIEIKSGLEEGEKVVLNPRILQKESGLPTDEKKVPDTPEPEIEGLDARHRSD